MTASNSSNRSILTNGRASARASPCSLDLGGEHEGGGKCAASLPLGSREAANTSDARCVDDSSAPDRAGSAHFPTPLASQMGGLPDFLRPVQEDAAWLPVFSDRHMRAVSEVWLSGRDASAQLSHSDDTLAW